MNSGGQQPQVVVPGAGWIDVASRVIVQVGFPVVVAGVLLWFILGHFAHDIGTIADRMENNAKAVESFTAIQNQQLGEMKAQTMELRQQTEIMREFILHRKYGRGESKE